MRSLYLGVAALCLAGAAGAQQFVFIYPEVNENRNSGFDDPAIVTSDITGQPVALGADRRACFEAAAAIWASHLEITVPVRVRAQFSAQGGSMNGAPLGFASPTTALSDFTGAPSGTYYPVALANQLHGSDLVPGTDDIVADFNSDVDRPDILGNVSWYYGTDGNPPGIDIDFFSTAMHELGHGLGFASFVDPTSGAFPDNTPDTFSRQLQDLTLLGQTSFALMTNANRKLAAIGGDLTWKGALVVGEKGGPVKMYAPSVLSIGSSVSHWDTSLSPNEVMEPFATDAFTDIGLEQQAFQDIGWNTVAAGVTISNESGASSIEEGTDLVLTSNISNATPVAYHWTRNGAALPGGNGPTFTKNSITPSDAGTYRLTVDLGAKAELTSNAIVISVVPVGSLPAGSALGLAAISTACAFSGAIRLRRRK